MHLLTPATPTVYSTTIGVTYKVLALTKLTEKALAPLRIFPNEQCRVEMDQSFKFFRLNFFTQVGAGGKGRSSCYHRFVERFPERKRITLSGSGDVVFDVGCTDISAQILKYVWPSNQISFSEHAELAHNFKLLTVERMRRTAMTVAEYKDSKTLPLHDYKFDPRLSCYQQVAAYNGCLNDGYALFMEQGTGKTFSAITIMDNLPPKQNGVAPRVIVVCPKNVRLNWVNELEEFSNYKNLKVTTLRGNELNRVKLITNAFRQEGEDASVLITSYGNLRQTQDVLCKAAFWDLAILDESHYIKTPTAGTTKAALLLRDRSKKRLVLTGTPVTNHPLDLWTQLEFTGEGNSGFHTWKAFKSYFGVFHKSEDNRYETLVGVQNQPFLKERLAAYSFMISKKEALPDLPEKLHDTVEVDMDKAQRKIYEDVATKLMHEIEAEENNGVAKQLIVNNVLVKMLRLAQITSGFVSYDQGHDEHERPLPPIIDRLDPNPKVEALVQLLEKKDDLHKTIVWACWVQDIKTISARLTVEGIKHHTYYGATSERAREEAVNSFNNDPDTKVFLGNQAAGATGINLRGYNYDDPDNSHTNCDQVVYYSQNWSSTLRSQSEDRAHRRGTRTAVQITDLCIPGTIDEEIRKRVLGKRKMALEVADLKEILTLALTLKENV